MKLPSAKIELVCGKRNVRQFSGAPYLDAEKSRLVATDSYIMAVLPVELEEGDTAGYIPLEAITRARKAKRGNLQVNGAVTVGGVQFSRPDFGPYPQYERVIPERPDRKPDITLDARLLYNLARAICDKKSLKVSLWIDGTGKVARVEPRAENGNFGAIALV